MTKLTITGASSYTIPTEQAQRLVSCTSLACPGSFHIYRTPEETSKYYLMSEHLEHPTIRVSPTIP